jgi:hypothetical protein
LLLGVTISLLDFQGKFFDECAPLFNFLYFTTNYGKVQT